MKEYGEEATSASGDVGPNGSNLMEFWGDKEDRVMLVATLAEDPDVVVGAVAVKKGPSYSDVEPESTEASIWRMSVSSNVRRRGLGKKLMQAAEEWARDKYHCTSMGLWTANAVAGKFYCDKAGFEVVPTEDMYSPHLKPLRYSKSLASS
jgi:ribosomal protein S18 acetylase RimI-like enzyme